VGTRNEEGLLDLVGALIGALGGPDFPGALRAAIGFLAPIDSLIVLAYDAERTPAILADGLHPEERDVFFDRYLTGAYLLSPFYQACMEASGPGFCTVAEIAPDDFFESEFFKVYYAPAGLVDEAGYVVPLGGTGAILVSIGRVRLAEPFTTPEAARLQAFLPVAAAAVRRHWQPRPGAGLPEGAWQPAIRAHVKQAFESFGTSLLTGREREVALLMLRGHSSKSAARLLDISPETERVHRRNIYDKLRVSSQAELCSLFFEALAGGPEGAEADPLTRLLDHRL
jgi:DNA-binding CsgD family transcriptional regulator